MQILLGCAVPSKVIKQSMATSLQSLQYKVWHHNLKGGC